MNCIWYYICCLFIWPLIGYSAIRNNIIKYFINIEPLNFCFNLNLFLNYCFAYKIYNFSAGFHQQANSLCTNGGFCIRTFNDQYIYFEKPNWYSQVNFRIINMTDVLFYSIYHSYKSYFFLSIRILIASQCIWVHA